MFKKYHEQQASATSDVKTFDRARGRNWLGNKVDQTAGNQRSGWHNGDGRSDRGDRNLGAASGGRKKTGDFKQLDRFRNGNAGVVGKQWSGNRQWSGVDKNRGHGQFGQWSKKGHGNWNPQTARWFGNRGYGDHRGHGDVHDGRGGKFDHQWADGVRRNWNNDWRKRHGHHDWDWYRGRNWRDVPFAYGWWGGRRNFGFNYYWNGWWNDPWFWWAPCTAPLLTTWIDFGWNYPCYWDYGYGPGAYVTYYNDAVYVGGQRYATELDYYAQVRNLARSVPTLTQNELAGIEWLPLGVFAVTQPGQQQATELMQLAVSKDGILSGTLLNQQTGQARPLQGMVDEATQKAAWMFADSPTDALVVETSLYNLTEPECTALAHLDAVNTEVWRLVRLKQPQPPAGGQPPAGAPAGQANAPAPAPAAQPVLPPQVEAK